MPATGVFPPLRILVMVRAIAPVAGMPPKSGVIILAIPCPISSVLERCLPPVAPSATIALSKDSIAPSMAMVKAGANNNLKVSKLITGRDGKGIVALISPKRVPMVSTGSWKAETAMVLNSSAIKVPGIFLFILGHITETSTVNKPIPNV